MKDDGVKVTTIDVLLVEDSPGDVRLTQEAFREANGSVRLHVAVDGVEGMSFLRQQGKYAKAPRPHIILLDLNLPKMDGGELLAIMKEDENLKSIPTVILPASEADADSVKSYEPKANCYLSKPVHLDAFEALVKSIDDFWINMVRLPPVENNSGDALDLRVAASTGSR